MCRVPFLLSNGLSKGRHRGRAEVGLHVVIIEIFDVANGMKLSCLTRQSPRENLGEWLYKCWRVRGPRTSLSRLTLPNGAKSRCRPRFLAVKALVRVLVMSWWNTYAPTNMRLRRIVSRGTSTTYIGKWYVLIQLVPVAIGIGYGIVGRLHCRCRRAGRHITVRVGQDQLVH